MTKQYDIIAAGECLVDFVSGMDEDKIMLEGNPGGAPANMLAMAARLGLSTAIAAKVGKDSFGAFLRKKIAEAGVDTAFLADDTAPTTLAIVSLDKTGNRSFSFYRNQTADVQLDTADLPLEAIAGAKIFHFGSVSLTAEPARTATLAAARHAKMNGVSVSYDPNLRPLLWGSLDEAKKMILEGMSLADLVKISDEELFFLTDAGSIEEGIEILWNAHPLALLAVTCGPKGCVCRAEAGTFSSPTYDTDCIDTTGSGDAFWGACLGWIIRREKLGRTLTQKELLELMDFCNAAGSLTATKRGAIPAMPSEEEIAACIREIPRCKA